MSDSFDYESAAFIPYRDKEVCRRVRAIKKDDLCSASTPEFRMSIVNGMHEMMLDYALDVVSTIQRSLEEGKERLVLLLPASVSPYAATIINALRIPCQHVHTFNMDEYADENGKSAPANWKFSFQKKVWDTFIGRIDEDLRMPESQVHFPSSENIGDYDTMIEDLGGIDVVFSQVGWNGHMAYIEPELGAEYADDLEGFKQLGAMTITLSPMTIMQNSLMFVKCGDWSWHPPKAVTVGPRTFVNARRNSWRQWGYIGGDMDMSWQRFIVRLVTHGPVTPLVPASILRTIDNTDFKILDSVAANCESAE